MSKSEVKTVIVSVPFEGYDEWGAEIERSVERDIERLESDEDSDEDHLAALRAGDVDYDAIYDAAANEYVSEFDELASEELGIKLGLQFESRTESEIFVSMPVASGKRLLGKSEQVLPDLDSLGWNEFLCNGLSDVADTMQRTFANMAESTDVFYPI